jgi:hypothetical protein
MAGLASLGPNLLTGTAASGGAADVDSFVSKSAALPAPGGVLARQLRQAVATHPTFRAAAPVVEPLHRDRLSLQNHAAIAAYLVPNLRPYFPRSERVTQRAAPNRLDSITPSLA